jgi:hypothetical protein
MKDKATVCFRRLATGEVTGEIISDGGGVFITRSFGVMSVEEFERLLEVIELEYPDICSTPTIEYTGN